MAVCSKCGGSGVYERRYSGEVLCANCFKASIVEKTRRTISRYGMVKFGERLGVAVSGGKDSLALLKVLDGLNQDSRFRLVALTVDEGVRGYREESIAHASDLTRQMKIEHLIISYQELFGFSLDPALDWRHERAISSSSILRVFTGRAGAQPALKA